MIYNSILLLHILGGLGVFISGSYFIYTSIKKTLSQPKRKMIFLGSLTAFQALSGIVLYLLSLQSTSLGAVCGKILIYVGFTAFTAAVVYKTQSKSTLEI